MYYVIGDSHTTAFSSQASILATGRLQQFGQFNCFHAGPFLAFNVKEKNEAIEVCQNIGPADSIIFCFGEIDMRNIHKRITAEESKFEDKINQVVENYFQFIDSINHPDKIVFGVVPCLKEQPFYKWFESNPERKNDFYAPSGDLTTRNLYKEYFNHQLQVNCEIKKIKYFDIFQEVLGKEELYMDDIHLNSPKVIDIINNKLKNFL